MATPINPTSLEAVQASSLASAKSQIVTLNNNLTAIYMTEFNNWSISVLAGRIPNTDPPKPPPAFVVGYFPDPTTGPGSMGPFGDMIIEWPFPKVGTEPVCAVPPIPQVPGHAVEGGWKIGKAIPGGQGVWFQALDGDTTADGATGPGLSQDGVQGLFMKVGFPMGNGWFKKIG